MTKPDYVAYWKQSAEQDWEIIEPVFEKKGYIQSLFFAHLVLEKLLKAHWVKDNVGDHPPRIHNLESIAIRTNLNLTVDQMSFLAKMNLFQMEGRYPDYQNNIHKLCTEIFTSELLDEVNDIRICLLKNLP